MTASPDPDPTEPGPVVERTTVVAVDDLDAHDVRRALVTLSAQRGPTLAPLVRSAAVPGGVALTHLVPAGSVSLASLRAAGPLRAGHVLAVGVAVLEALVVLHDAALAHGGVGGDTVLVGPDGRVVLTATGSAWRTAPGEVDGPTPTGDVESVGELVRDLLGPGSAPAPLVVAVVRALDPDLALRPDAAALLEALRRCGRPDSLLDALWAPHREAAPGHAARPAAEQPGSDVGDPATDEADEGDDHGDLDSDDGAPEAGRPMPAVLRPGALRPAPARTRSRRRAPRRTGRRRTARGRAGGQGTPSHPRLFAGVLVAALALGALVAAARSAADVAPATTPVAALTPASSDPRSSSAAATPTSTSVAPMTSGVDWRDVLTAVDRGRTAALAVGSGDRLREWVTGTAYAADLTLARTVAAAGARIEGGQLVLDDVEVLSEEATTAVLRVRDRRTAYAVVVDGTRQEVPERAARTWTVTLVRGGSPVRWRIAEVADAALSPGGRR